MKLASVPTLRGCREEIGKYFGETLVGNQLVSTKVKCGRSHPLAILDRRGYPCWKGSGNLGSTMMTRTLFGAMLAHFQPDRGKLKDLPVFTLSEVEFPVCFAHDDTALWTADVFGKAMFDNMIGIGDALQSLTATSLLSARFATGPAAQTFWLRWIGEVARIRGRWLTAGTRVPLQICDLGLKCFDAIPKLEELFHKSFGIALRQLDKLLFCRAFSLHEDQLIP